MSFSSLVARAGSLDSNPLTSDIDITYGGTNWLWVVFAIMLSSNLLVLGWTLTLNPAHRAFHYLSVAILTTASIAYFSLAADLGSTPIRVEFLKGFTLGQNASYPTRSIWYVRYIDWVITTPLLLLELLLVSGLPLSTVFSSIFFDEVMIITGLIGALVSSSYKWGYWAFGTVAMFYIFYVLYVPGLKSAKTLGAEYKKSYLVSTSILVGLWFLYPIAWALAEGSNTISPTGEAIFYGVLDILAKPVFTFVHLYSLRNLDYDLFGLSSGKRSDFVTSSQVEKGAHVHTNEHQKAEHPTTANVVPNHTTAAPVRNSEVTVA